MRMTSGAIALALVVVSSLTCLIGTTQLSADTPRMSMPQHGCCAGMNQKCPDAVSASQNDCCITQSVSTTAIQADHAASPLALLSAMFVSVPPLRNVAGPFDADLLKSSTPPPYLLDVVFRI
jgi:hypothetical protein